MKLEKDITSSRIKTADLLKGIAAILMIQVHIIELFATNDISESTAGKFLLFLGGPAVAPVFIILLGYFIAESKKSSKVLVIRGLKYFFGGLVLNFALNFNLIFSVFIGTKKYDILPYIFGVDILQLTGISIISIALLKNLLDRSNVIIILLMFCVALLGNVLLNFTLLPPFLKYGASLFYGASWWSYFPFFPWFSYALAGILFYKLRQSLSFDILNNFKSKIIIGILFLFFLLFTIKYGISISSDLPSYYHHGIVFFLWVLIFISFYSFFIHEIEKLFGSTRVFNFIKFLGKNITVLYVFQWLIIGNIATDLYKTVSSAGQLIWSFVFIFLFSAIFCYLWIKVKGIFIEKLLANKHG